MRALTQPAGERGFGVGQGQQTVAEERHRDGVDALLGTQGARRGAARIGERLPSVRGTHLVAVLELGGGHEDFAAHLDGDRLGQLEGQALDGADRVRDVLPGRPVPTGDQLSQPASGVAGGDRQPVQLRLDAEPLDLVADTASQGGGPGGELLRREHIVQAQHRHRVRDIALNGAAGDLPHGRVGQHLLGMVGLPGRDAARQPVVGIVVQHRRAARVVGGRRFHRVLDRLRVGGGIHDHCSWCCHACHPACHH